MDYLGLWPDRARRRLKHIPGNLGTQQKNLDSLYAKVLEVAFTGLEENGEYNENDEQMRVLCAIISVKDPVSPLVIARLLNLRIESVKEAAESLSTVIPFDEDLDRPLRVCHKSFSDFLTHQPSSSTFTSHLQEIVQVLANGCLDVLMNELKFNICNLDTSYLFNDEVKDLDLKIRTKYSR